MRVLGVKWDFCYHENVLYRCFCLVWMYLFLGASDRPRHLTMIHIKYFLPSHLNLFYQAAEAVFCGWLNLQHLCAQFVVNMAYPLNKRKYLL